MLILTVCIAYTKPRIGICIKSIRFSVIILSRIQNIEPILIFLNYLSRLCANTKNCCCKAPLFNISAAAIPLLIINYNPHVVIYYANLRNFNPAAPKPSMPSRTAPGTGTRLISPHSMVALSVPSGDWNSSRKVIPSSLKPSISNV